MEMKREIGGMADAWEGLTAFEIYEKEQNESVGKI